MEQKKKSFRLVRKDEPLEISSLVVVLFGVPGVYKTSTAFTADRAILEDYDDGVKRSVKRGDYLQIGSYQEVLDFHESEDFKEMAPKTVIMDTGGTFLDNFVGDHVIRMNSKNGKAGGGIALEGYGAMKVVFHEDVARAKRNRIDLIVVCHAEQFKDGDQVKYRPKMTGGSYDILLGAADLVGFVETINDKSTITFSPTDRNVGKNSARFPKLEIPHFTDKEHDGFMAGIIQQTKDRMLEQSEAQKEALDKLEKYRVQIGEATIDDLQLLDTAVAEMSPTYRVQLESLINDKYAELLALKYGELKGLDDINAFLKIVKDTPRLDSIRKLKKDLNDYANSIGFQYNQTTKIFELKPVDTAKKEEPVQTTAATDTTPAPEAKEEPVAEVKEVKVEEKVEPSKTEEKKAETPQSNGKLL